jgi:N-acetylglucosamine-6-phosphate deacetylase
MCGMIDAILIRGGDVVTADRVLRRTDVLVRGRRIARIGRRLRAPRGARMIDARGGIVAPGLIDLQVNGAAGVMFGECRPSDVRAVSRCMAAHGVTGYCPTLISLPHARTLEGIRTILSAEEGLALNETRRAPGRVEGARNLGLHLEGPFLNPERHGAHRPGYLCDPDRGRLDACLQAARGRIAVVTLAPERRGATDAIRFLAGRGVCVSAGHSMASLAEMEGAVKAGLRLATHLYNAMRPFHQRAPGIIEAALTLDALAVDLIADGVHVHPPAVDIFLRCKPPDKVILVSDAVATAGAPDGRAAFDGRALETRGGAAYLAGTDALSGSSTLLLQGVRNLVDWFDLPLPRAFRTASLNPAAVLGIARRKGSLAPGRDADVAVLDRAWTVRATMVEGRLVHQDGSL